MPSTNTECTELAVGFGLLGIEPSKILKNFEIDNYFLKTLTLDKYNNFVREFASNKKAYLRFYDIGLRLRKSYLLFRGSNLKQIQWEGPNQQASTVTIAKDLLALNTPISIKDNSNVVSNPSPYNLFVRIPQGLPDLKRSANWYLTIVPEEYQSLYSFVRDTWCPDYTPLISSYHKSTKKPQRLLLADKVKTAEKLTEFNFQKYKEFYIHMCQRVAELSAAQFNQYFTESLNNQERNPVIETIIRSFFRIGEQKYILCGLDHSKDFAVEIPDLTTWKKHWRFKSLDAFPDKEIEREQAVVKFRLVLENKNNRKQFELVYHAEIRWSHGRFCGNPEAKLYKDFLWSEVPFFTPIIKNEVFQKLHLIGTGGFGIVYKAINKITGEICAIKELSDNWQSLHEHERFAREVKIQSHLNHPNVLAVIQSDLTATPPWFVMPLAQGSLEEAIEHDNELSNNLARVNFIFKQVLDGIKYAHDHQIVHRDLKPANIFRSYAVDR